MFNYYVTFFSGSVVGALLLSAILYAVILCMEGRGWVIARKCIKNKKKNMTDNKIYNEEEKA